MPSPSASSHASSSYTISKQSITSASNDSPPASDNTRSTTHALSASPSTSRTVNTPLPAGITEPENENPSTVVALVDTVKPLASASPPDAPTTVTPSTLNWNPAISASLLYKISIKCVSQLVPSPLHSPQSSYSPTQSSTSSQIPSPSASSHASSSYTISKQSITSASNDSPPASDNTRSTTHALSASPSTSRTVNTPLPAGITEPENENPSTVVALVDTVKPLASASPPDAPTTVTPSTLNWNPAIS